MNTPTTRSAKGIENDKSPTMSVTTRFKSFVISPATRIKQGDREA